MEREPNTQYVLSLSYGKDSIACIEACRQLGYPLDRIVHAEVWATDDIPADLPPMVDFKAQADKIILERYGIVVEHVCATDKSSQAVNVERERERERETSSVSEATTAFSTQSTPTQTQSAKSSSPSETASTVSPCELDRGATQDLKSPPLPKLPKLTYEKMFYKKYTSKSKSGGISMLRFPTAQRTVVPKPQNTPFSECAAQGAKINTVQYLGIAADEPERIARHSKKKGIVLPLVDIGWDEAYCRKWCEANGLLSPTYTTSMRGGCWFCPNQGIDQLRLLRANYPDLWALLLKWDNDSPVSFRADGHTVHDFDERFAAEEKGTVPKSKFKWSMLDELKEQTKTIEEILTKGSD